MSWYKNGCSIPKVLCGTINAEEFWANIDKKCEARRAERKKKLEMDALDLSLADVARLQRAFKAQLEDIELTIDKLEQDQQNIKNLLSMPIFLNYFKEIEQENKRYNERPFDLLDKCSENETISVSMPSVRND